MTPPALSLRGVRVDYDGRAAAALAALDVAPGETVALRGPNGSGKSTLLRVMALVELPAAGTVRIRGGAGGRRDVTLALPQPWLFAGTALQNVESGLVARGVARPDRHRRAREMLDVLGIDGLADRDARRLSSGESARVSLARALVLETPVLLLDEPFAHLDPEVIPAARAAVERRLAAGAAVVFAVLGTSDLHGVTARVVAPDESPHAGA